MITPFNGTFQLTQGFGENPANYERFGLKGHNGLDYGLPMGTEVLAPHDGKIIEAANDPGGYGNYLKIENGKEGSVLAHLQDFTVQAGNIVIEGQVIAHSNNTGNSTGPHLHWGYYLFPRDRSNGYNGFIDQLPILNASTGTTEPLATITQKELDSLRKARDDNWQKYQNALLDNKNLLIDYNNLVDKIQQIKGIVNG